MARKKPKSGNQNQQGAGGGGNKKKSQNKKQNASSGDTTESNTSASSTAPIPKSVTSENLSQQPTPASNVKSSPSLQELSSQQLPDSKRKSKEAKDTKIDETKEKVNVGEDSKVDDDCKGETVKGEKSTAKSAAPKQVDSKQDSTCAVIDAKSSNKTKANNDVAQSENQDKAYLACKEASANLSEVKKVDIGV